MTDAVHIAMRRACGEYGHAQIFSSANFSYQLRIMAGLASGVVLDGRWVEVILCGRADVEMLAGGSHWRLIELPPPA